ncbi:MAG TPA: hypothetical protein VJ867_00535 [Gemmatimonadaceae bacterium]|nr:hypothetical protein [Gemmatimonadaceae bacterium]
MNRRVVLLLALCLSGCRFWYKPVPVADAIGEERTVFDGDSVNIYRDGRFEVYGRNAEAVYDGYEQLNRAYRAFERHFGVVPPKLAFVLTNDTTKPVQPATIKSFADRGFRLVRYVRPRSYKNPTRYGALGYGGVIWPVAPTAARIMLAEYAVHASGGAPWNEHSTHADDAAALERLPMWLRAAVIHLLGEAGTASTDLDDVRDHLGSVMPLRDLVTLVRPASADSLLDPTRRGEADETTRLAAAQAATFGEFMIEREGYTVLAKLARGYLDGRSFNEMLAELEHTPHDIKELEARWRVWVETREN